MQISDLVSGKILDMSKKHRQHQDSPSKTVKDSNPPPKDSLSIYEKRQLALQEISVKTAIGVLVLSVFSFGLATWQFNLARAERREASDALDLAKEAQEATQQAKAQIELHELKLTNLTSQLATSAELAKIHDWSIKAEAGDRAAFMELQHYVWETSSNSASYAISFAQKNVNRIHQLYTGEKILDPGVAQGEWTLSVIWPTNTITINLESDNYTSRAAAVGTIGTLRLNTFIPTLADMAQNEPDLYVLQLIVKTINNAFAGCAPRAGFTIDDFLFPHYEGKKKFDAEWAEFGPSILKRKSKYVVSEQVEGSIFNQRIVDPEAK